MSSLSVLIYLHCALSLLIAACLLRTHVHHCSTHRLVYAKHLIAHIHYYICALYAPVRDALLLLISCLPLVIEHTVTATTNATASWTQAAAPVQRPVGRPVSNAFRGAKSSSAGSMSSSTSVPVSHAAAAVIAAVTADAIAQRQQEGGANIAGTVSVWSDVDEAWEEASYQRDARAG
jgi:hypothetical protein